MARGGQFSWDLHISKSDQFSDILQTAMLAVSNFDNSVLCLNSLSAPVKNQIWEDILVKVMRQNYQGQVLMEFQKVLLTKVSDKKLYLHKILSDFKNLGDLNSVNCFNSINELDKLDTESKLSLDVFKHLPPFQATPVDFIAFVKLAKENYTRYNINCDVLKLDQHLSETLLSVDSLNSIDFLPIIISNYPFPLFIEKIETAIEASKGNSSLKALMALLYDRYKKAKIDKPLMTILDNASIDVLLQVVNETENFYYDLIAMAFSRFETYTGAYPNSLTVFLESSDEEKIEKIAERIEYYEEYGKLLLASKTIGSTSKFISVVQKLTAKSYGTSKLSVSLILQNFQAIAKAGINPDSLIERLDGWTHELEPLNFKKIKELIPDISFFKHAVNIDNNFATFLVEKLILYFNSINLEDWKNFLVVPTVYEFQALLFLKNYSLPINGVDAVKYTLQKIASGEIPTPDKRSWDIILGRLPQAAAITTFKDLADQFCDHDTINISLFSFFADGLLSKGHLERRENSLRKIFTADILRSVECRRIIARYKTEFKNINEAADSDDADDFRNRVQELLANENSDDTIFEIAHELGISKKKDDEDEADYNPSQQ